MNKHNPPAFPRPHSWDESPVKGWHEGDNPAAHREQEGMTLRDYFAAQATIGMLADTEAVSEPASIARAAYAYADAMLKERAK
jgi:hypothetical protein